MKLSSWDSYCKWSWRATISLISLSRDPEIETFSSNRHVVLQMTADHLMELCMEPSLSLVCRIPLRRQEECKEVVWIYFVCMKPRTIYVWNWSVPRPSRRTLCITRLEQSQSRLPSKKVLGLAMGWVPVQCIYIQVSWRLGRIKTWRVPNAHLDIKLRSSALSLQVQVGNDWVDYIPRPTMGRTEEEVEDIDGGNA